MQYKVFMVPMFDGCKHEEELNRFLNSNNIISVEKYRVDRGDNLYWGFLVEYSAGSAKLYQLGKNTVDYKEILSDEEFSIYSRLREIRNGVARDKGLPFYAIFKNEHLAEIARKRPKTLNELMKISGIGNAKAEKYGSLFLLDTGKEDNEKTAEPISENM